MTNQQYHLSKSESTLIPVTLLTGFLGSGKTSVLNHLVCQPEMSDALVIINEFGEMALDHELVAHSTENLVMEMSSGCVCCSIRGDLVQTLRDITWRYVRNGKRWFQRVLIETTGLADPAPIIHTLITHLQIARKYKLDGIVSTVDAATGINTMNQYQEAVKQAAMADILLLTKADLVTKDQYDVILNRLDKINPAAPRFEVINGEITAQKVLNLGLFNAEDKTPNVKRWLKQEAYSESESHEHNLEHNHKHHNHSAHDSHDDHHHDISRHDDYIRAFCFTIEQPIPENILTDWLELLKDFVGSKILRVKGILNIEGKENPLALHGVQHIFHPTAPLPGWTNEDHRSKLVFITYGVSRNVIEKTFNIFGKYE